MGSYVTLEFGQAVGGATTPEEVVNIVRSAIQALERNATALGVVPNWDAVTIDQDFDMVSEYAYDELPREVVGNSTLHVTVRAYSEAEEEDEEEDDPYN